MELYEKPNSVFVAGFIGSPKMNFITGAPADKTQSQDNRRAAGTF